MFEDKTWAIFPVLFVILVIYTGLYMVIYIANLQKIPPSVIEAAIIDGASEGQVLARVIFPGHGGCALHDRRVRHLREASRAST